MANPNFNLSKLITELNVLLNLLDPRISVLNRINEITQEMQIKIVTQENSIANQGQELQKLKAENKQLKDELEKLQPESKTEKKTDGKKKP